jgi:hypothetical protein
MNLTENAFDAPPLSPSFAHDFETLNKKTNQVYAR